MRSLYLEKSIQVSQIILFNLHSITHITFIVRKEVLAESLLLLFVAFKIGKTRKRISLEITSSIAAICFCLPV